MPFVGVASCPTCSWFLVASGGSSLKFQNAELSWNNPRTVICNPLTNSNRCFSFVRFFCCTSLSFRGGLVDRFFFCGWAKGSSFFHFTLIFLKYWQCGEVPIITPSIRTTSSVFVFDTCKTIFHFRMDFSLSFGYIVFPRKCFF